MADQGHRTADVYRTDPNLPFRFNNPDCIRGYSEKKSHPLYRTSNQEFGSQKPTVHEMPTQYKGSSHKFSTAMLQSGMYRDNGFNTSLDRSRLILSTATQKKRDDLRYYYHCVNQINDGNN